jgi:hypothetical protein
MIALTWLLPAWSRLKAVAHTLPYDMTVMVGRQPGAPLTAGDWNTATMPTLVLVGGKSPTWFHHNRSREAVRGRRDRGERPLRGDRRRCARVRSTRAPTPHVGRQPYCDGFGWLCMPRSVRGRDRSRFSGHEIVSEVAV